jgi:YcxB-like protein
MAKGFSQGQQRRVQQPMPSNPLAIKTKKFALEKNKFITLNIMQVIRTKWYWGFAPLALILINAGLNISKVYPNYWIYVIAVLAVILYIAFWAIQFTGVTQLEQYKQLFQKYRYEIDSRQILMKLNDTEGGIIKWDMIKSARKEKDGFVLDMGQFQFIHLPLTVFNSDSDKKLMERILKDKGYLEV